jgi:hypothetical protein
MPKKPHTQPDKGGIIRPGQNRPYSKGTQEQIEERIAFVDLLLFSRRARKSQIHKALLIKYDVDWRQTDRYMATARENRLEMLRQTKEYHRCNSLALYEQILSTGTPREKIMAQERIDRLLGLESPRSISLGGIEGAPPIPVAGHRYDPRQLDVSKLKQLKTILSSAKVKEEIEEATN